MSVFIFYHSQQSDQGLHSLPFSAVWSRTTLFAILSLIRVYTICHSFYAALSRSTLFSILSILIIVYTTCHSQQSDQGQCLHCHSHEQSYQGLHYLPFSVVWSRSRSTLAFSGTVWSGSSIFVILKSLIWVYTVCHSQQSNQGLFCLPFSVIWSGSTLFAILSCLIKVYTVCHSQQSDEGLHYLPF